MMLERRSPPGSPSPGSTSPGRVRKKKSKHSRKHHRRKSSATLPSTLVNASTSSRTTTSPTSASTSPSTSRTGKKKLVMSPTFQRPQLVQLPQVAPQYKLGKDPWRHKKNTWGSALTPADEWNLLVAAVKDPLKLERNGSEVALTPILNPQASPTNETHAQPNKKSPTPSKTPPRSPLREAAFRMRTRSKSDPSPRRESKAAIGIGNGNGTPRRKKGHRRQRTGESFLPGGLGLSRTLRYVAVCKVCFEECTADNILYWLCLLVIMFFFFRAFTAITTNETVTSCLETGGKPSNT